MIKERALTALFLGILCLSFICEQGIASEKDIINDTSPLPDEGLNLPHPEGNDPHPFAFLDEDLLEIGPEIRTPRSLSEGKLGASIIPGAEWQKCLGGSRADGANSIQQTSDGGYVVAGYTDSSDGDVSSNHGGYGDCWVVKVDRAGTMQWQKCLGGSNRDEANSIQQTSDGGYIVAGMTYSNDGDVSGNHGSGGDYWVVKVNSAETMQWVGVPERISQ